MQEERSHRFLGRSSESAEMLRRVGTRAGTGTRTRNRGPAAPRLGREQVSGPGPCSGWGIRRAGRAAQLPLVVVLAAAAGVAACAVATVVAVVLAVVLAVVAAVVLAAVAAVVATVADAAVAAVTVDAASELAAVVPAEPFAAPTAMHPVRIAAAATPAAPVTRRARRAGCGRRRRVGRLAAGVWGELIGDSVTAFMPS